MDEATSALDNLTEKYIVEEIEKLRGQRTVIIIAHRLNTIANADEIFFVNGGEITPAGSLKEAIDMLLHRERTS